MFFSLSEKILGADRATGPQSFGVSRFTSLYPLRNIQRTDILPEIMRKDLHPNEYRPVVFQDESAGFTFLTQSTAQTNDTIKWEDGNEYPLVKVHISSASHPFFTGEEKIIDTEGRVDRFKSRQAAAQQRRSALANKAKKTAKKATRKATKTEDKDKK
jgi:large subunit ribosomal protein L31